MPLGLNSKMDIIVHFGTASVQGSQTSACQVYTCQGCINQYMRTSLYRLRSLHASGCKSLYILLHT